MLHDSMYPLGAPSLSLVHLSKFTPSLLLHASFSSALSPLCKALKLMSNLRALAQHLVYHSSSVSFPSIMVRVGWLGMLLLVEAVGLSSVEEPPLPLGQCCGWCHCWHCLFPPQQLRHYHLILRVSLSHSHPQTWLVTFWCLQGFLHCHCNSQSCCYFGQICHPLTLRQPLLSALSGSLRESCPLCSCFVGLG